MWKWKKTKKLFYSCRPSKLLDSVGEYLCELILMFCSRTMQYRLHTKLLPSFSHGSRLNSLSGCHLSFGLPELSFSPYLPTCSPVSCSSPGLLEDERLASAHQAEAFTRQIQNLQGINVTKFFTLPVSNICNIFFLYYHLSTVSCDTWSATYGDVNDKKINLFYQALKYERKINTKKLPFPQLNWLSEFDPEKMVTISYISFSFKQ